jgi:tRNA pseudouridine38-40 synthase
MVSANHSIFELFLQEPLSTTKFLYDFNSNLPADIRATKIEETDRDFNIIQTPKLKKYIYLFSYGEKCHPFTASLLASFMENLDIDLMMKGALLFQGTHNFKKYCTKPSKNTNFEREVLVSRIEINNQYKANFFPASSYTYHVYSAGFMRNQIRLMMGQLIKLGKGEIGLDEIEYSLQYPDEIPLDYIAPASGLILNHVGFDN